MASLLRAQARSLKSPVAPAGLFLFSRSLRRGRRSLRNFLLWVIASGAGGIQSRRSDQSYRTLNLQHGPLAPKVGPKVAPKVGSGRSIFPNGTTFWSRRERASASSLRVALFWHSSLYPENNTTCRLPRGAFPEMQDAGVCATSRPSSPRLAARTARRAPERSSRASLLRRAVRGSIYARANRSSPRP